MLGDRVSASGRGGGLCPRGRLPCPVIRDPGSMETACPSGEKEPQGEVWVSPAQSGLGAGVLLTPWGLRPGPGGELEEHAQKSAGGLGTTESGQPRGACHSADDVTQRTASEQETWPRGRPHALWRRVPCTGRFERLLFT